MLQRYKDQKVRVCGKCSVSLDKMLLKKIMKLNCSVETNPCYIW